MTDRIPPEASEVDSGPPGPQRDQTPDPMKTKPPTTIKTLDEVRKEHVFFVLSLLDWHVSKTALALDIDRRTMYRLISRYELKRPSHLPASESEPPPANNV